MGISAGDEKSSEGELVQEVYRWEVLVYQPSQAFCEICFWRGSPMTGKAKKNSCVIERMVK